MRLSVVVPAYNRAAALRRSLDCLREQSYPAADFEVIVVDDGSTDETPSVLEELGSELPDTYRTFRQDNAGPARARNFGISQARGDLVVLLQDDIFATVDLLSHHEAAHAEREPEVVVLGQTQWSEDLENTPFMEFLMRGDQFAFDWIEDRENVPYNFFYSSNVSFPRAAVERWGGFDEDFPYAAWEDTELGLRLARNGVRMVYEPRALAHHHHPTTLASFLDKRHKIGIASTILYRKAPECADMMRYDRRPAGLTLSLSHGPYLLTRALAEGAERTGLDRRLPAKLRDGMYRWLLDHEYFQGVREGMRLPDSA